MTDSKLDKPDTRPKLPGVVYVCAFCHETSELWPVDKRCCKSCGHLLRSRDCVHDVSARR